ncbi:hypothetical protein EON63_16280 [archaeon]|nr:MAG: hypothetical protein EON63_16280 [archaeon]
MCMCVLVLTWVSSAYDVCVIMGVYMHGIDTDYVYVCMGVDMGSVYGACVWCTCMEWGRVVCMCMGMEGLYGVVYVCMSVDMRCIGLVWVWSMCMTLGIWVCVYMCEWMNGYRDGVWLCLMSMWRWYGYVLVLFYFILTLHHTHTQRMFM